MKKQEGQYMSPNWLVELVLDDIKYTGKNVLTKKIIEPSFGDGAFLINITERIILECLKHEKHEKEIITLLKQNVFGIEKDIILYNQAISKLNVLLQQYNINPINWKENLIHGDTLLLYQNYKGKMDLVVGNPPYIRIHNIPEAYRKIIEKFRFSKGIRDMYIVFYEI